MATLNTVKDSNRRLLDQIRQQTDEIQNLTQQRVLDEEAMENLRWQHQSDVDQAKQEAHRDMLVLKDKADERVDIIKGYYDDKLRHLKTRLEIAKQEMSGLRQVHFEQRQEVKLTAEAVYQQVRASEKDTLLAWDTVAKRQAQEKATLQDFIHELEVKLATEKELRQGETSHLQYQRTCLQAEKEDLQAKMARDVNQLSGQIAELDRTITVERQMWATERQKLEVNIEDLVRQHQNADDMLESSNRNCVKFESQLVAAETDLKAKEQQIIELKRQVRESDDALGCAVRGNEHLREQIEEQMTRYQEMNAKDLAAAKASYDEQLMAFKAKADNEKHQLTRCLRQVEENHSGKCAELERLKQHFDALELEKSGVLRDMNMWKNQYQSATEVRQDLERDLAEARQEWSKEKLRLQEGLDDTTQTKQLLEADLKVTTEQFHEYKRQTQQRETDAATRNHAFEEQLRQRENQVADIMAQLVDQQDFAQKLKTELASEQQRSAEKQSRMEAELEQRTAEKQDIARRLEQTIITERKELAEAKEQYDRWREAHVHSLKQIQDESQLKVAAVEKDKQLLEERLRGELADSIAKLEDGKKKRESLETEIQNVYKNLSKAQQDTNLSRSKVEQFERELANVKEKSSQELKALNHQLSDARLAEKRIASELKEELQARERDEARHKKDVEEIKSMSASQVMDIDQKFRGMKAEYESTLNMTESRYRDAVNREKSKLDTITSENDQLRKIISSNDYRSPGIGTLTSTVEGHLSRFTSKVDELRQDLSAPRVSATPRSQSPAGYGVSPGRDMPLLSTTSSV